MILLMNSKTFFKTFLECESDDTILEANYILASNKIRYSREYDHMVISSPFYPSDYAIMKLNDEKEIKPNSNSEYVKKFNKDLKKSMGVIAEMIIIDYMEPEKLTIILTTKKEQRALGILNIFQKWVFDTFDIYIPEYKNGYRVEDFEMFKIKNDQYFKARKLLKKAEKRDKKKLFETKKGQFEYYSRLSKKELKKELKKNSLYLPGMDKKEMIETALTFLV